MTKQHLSYDPNNNCSDRKSKNRSRKITWFNPPYSRNVRTNVGAKFLKIINRNFPANHPLHKIINKNTIKVSYRCMPNLKNHNSQNDNLGEAGCNCLASRKDACPMPGRCTTSNVVYRATVRRHDSCSIDCYTGLTGDKFKTRFNKHQSDIRTGKKTASKLASHVQVKGSEHPI